MANELRDKRIAFLVANEGIEQVELTSPWQAVKDVGGQPVLVATKRGKAQAFNHLDKADSFNVDAASSEVTVDEFDALVLPGGVANADELRTDEHAVRLVREFFDTGRPVGVICHGPWAIVEADRVRGRTLTSWPSLQTDIRNASGVWMNAEVKICEGGPNLLVSSRKPDDLPVFNTAIISAFAQARRPAANRNGQQGYADPQDLQFGAGARRKEEELDRALAEGRGVPADEPPSERPRAGSKAQPR